MINLLLVDDHPLVRDGIRARLESEPGIKVLGEAQDGQEALDFVAQQEVSGQSSSCQGKVDVILMDISMPVMNGLEATKIFKDQHPDVRILILSMHDSREYILQLIQSGASGYILKDVSSDELIKAIETVHQGGTYFSSGASQSLFSGEQQIPTPETAAALTPREATVLKHLAEGQSNKEIARVLDISVRTVETHRQNIKQKLNIHTAAGLARYAIENGLVD